jgi:hypothetical protein
MQKLWMQRRGQLFTTAASTGFGSGPQSTEYLRQLPTERSKDNRTQEEVMAVLKWVSSFFAFLSLVALDF